MKRKIISKLAKLALKIARKKVLYHHKNEDLKLFDDRFHFFMRNLETMSVHATFEGFLLTEKEISVHWFSGTHCHEYKIKQKLKYSIRIGDLWILSAIKLALSTQYLDIENNWHKMVTYN